MTSGTTDIEKMRKTATRSSSFQFVRPVTHFQFARQWLANLVHASAKSFLVLVYYLPMAAIAAANIFDMWQFSKTATDGLNTHMQ